MRLKHISVTAQCEWDAEGKWNVVETFDSLTHQPVGDPGLYSFDPEDDSFVDPFLEGIFRELQEVGSLVQGEAYRIEALIKDGECTLVRGWRIFRSLGTASTGTE